MDMKTLRSKSKEALQKELEEARVHLKELQFKNSANQLKQVRQIRQIRRLIAQVMTLLSQ